MSDIEKNPVDRLIGLFEVKAKAFAAELGVPYTTVHGWRKTGRVPRWRHASIIGLAERKGVDRVAIASLLSADEGVLT